MHVRSLHSLLQPLLTSVEVFFAAASEEEEVEEEEALFFPLATVGLTCGWMHMCSRDPSIVLHVWACIVYCAVRSPLAIIGNAYEMRI